MPGPLKDHRDQKKSRDLGVSPSAKLPGIRETRWTRRVQFCVTLGNHISFKTLFFLYKIGSIRILSVAGDTN